MTAPDAAAGWGHIWMSSDVRDMTGSLPQRSDAEEAGRRRVSLELEQLEPRILLNGGSPEIERVSLAWDGSEGLAASGRPAISEGGRYVAFESAAPNLVVDDTNYMKDIFVVDRDTGAIERVSVSSVGQEANDLSGTPAISADGRYVAFESWASNLVPGDANGACDVFVYDRQTSTIERVSVASGGGDANADSYGPSISADGRYVAFDSDASDLVPGDSNGAADVFVRDRQSGTTERVSLSSGGAEGDGHSYYSAISADGRYVAFWSEASNLVAGDTNNFCGAEGDDNCADVFVRDRQTGTTERVSVDSAGNEGSGDDLPSLIILILRNPGSPPVTADGRYVAFASQASNLVPGDTNNFCGLGDDENCYDIFVRDRAESVTVQAGAGETVTTDGEADGATALDPVETSLTTPNAGSVSIEETPITATPPAGFQFLSQQVSITAPSAMTDDPLVIVFRIDTSQVPAGEDENTIQMFKDGVEVPACAGSPGTASPDPCVSSRVLLPDGDVEITVLTSTASAWNFGAPAEPSPTPTPAPAPVGGIAQLPDASDSSARNHIPLAVLAAAALLALTAGAWYARRRWLA